MILIENVVPKNKGSLLAICDVHIVPWKLTMKDVKIFQKGVQKWLGMPSSEFTNRDGEKKYKELVVFDNPAIAGKFRDQVMTAVDSYLADNPDMETPDVITNEEIPF